MTKKISVVMCTYNGEEYLPEQLDSILGQTLPPYEIIVQDDGSTDGTLALLHAYAERHACIKVYSNEGPKGINSNFFSAMSRATGDFIAISDQDDVWLPEKLEVLSEGIGEKLMCVGRSQPFVDSDDKGHVTIHVDPRKPNCNVVRLCYASMPGHCMLFRRELLEHLPSHLETRPVFTHTWYDVILGTVAAALDSIVLVDRFVVHWRRHVSAASYANYDTKRIRSANNALSMVWFGIRRYGLIKPLMAKHFSVRCGFLESIQSDAPIYRDVVKLLHYEGRTDLFGLFGLWRMYVKYRHVLFYTYEKDPVALVRALLHPFMQVYNYRYLYERLQQQGKKA